MNKSVRLLAIAGLFSALITAVTSLKIPLVYGYIHPGDSIIYLAACVLPTPYALLAASIGGALADTLAGYPQYIIPTVIVKALITLPFSPKTDKILTKRNLFAVVPAGIITVWGYFAAEWVLYKWAGAVVGLPKTALQAAGSAVLFIIFAAALDKMRFKKMF